MGKLGLLMKQYPISPLPAPSDPSFHYRTHWTLAIGQSHINHEIESIFVSLVHLRS